MMTCVCSKSERMSHMYAPDATAGSHLRMLLRRRLHAQHCGEAPEPDGDWVAEGVLHGHGAPGLGVRAASVWSTQQLLVCPTA